VRKLVLLGEAAQLLMHELTYSTGETIHRLRTALRGLAYARAYPELTQGHT
jgi:hypothetical protein